MSTTFGVKIDFKHLTNTIFEDENNIIEVAYRGRAITFTNPLAVLLPDDTEVIPLDNDSQGILTIGDIKKAIETYKKEL